MAAPLRSSRSSRFRRAAPPAVPPVRQLIAGRQIVGRLIASRQIIRRLALASGFTAATLVATTLASALLCVTILSLLARPVHAQPAEIGPEREYARAVELFEQRLYRQSSAAFTTFRMDHPNHASVPQALYLEARSALALDREADAIRLFEKLETTYPAHPRAAEAQISLGQYFLDEGEPRRGREILERIARENPDSPNAARAIYTLGASEREAGNLSEAAGYFERVLRDFPNSDIAPAAAYDLAATRVRQEDFEAAARAFEQLSRQYPSSPYAENLGTAVAEVYYELGQYDRVVEELRPRLPNLPPDERARGTFFLAEAYNQLRNTENAIVYYRQLIDSSESTPYVRPAHYGMGWNYLRADNPSEAAQSFAQVRAAATGDEMRDELSLRATYYEAVAETQAGRPERAQQLYRSVVETWPNAELGAPAQHELGILQYRAQNYAGAAASFRSVVQQSPDDALLGDAYYMLGNAYTATKDLDRALDAYSQAIQRDAAPDSLRREVQFQKAWTLYENERYEDASRAFASLARDGSGQRSRDALFWNADCRYQTGDYSGARAGLLRYLERYPDGRHGAAAQYALGWTYFRQRDYRPAAQAFRTFLDTYREPDSEIPYRQDARLRLADSYYAMKRYNDAVTEYRRVDGQGVDYALYQTGEALSRADRFDEAIRTLRRLVQDYPDSPWREQARLRIGGIQFQNQDYEGARQTYREIIAQSPGDQIEARAQYGIGDTYYNAGEMDQAVQAYRNVLEDYPQSRYASDAASSLQFALLSTGDRDRADEIIEEFARENPDSPMVDELRFRQAEATYQSGDVDRALQLFRRFVRRSTSESLLPEAYYYLGEIYVNRDQPAEARTYLRQLVDRYPNTNRRPEAALRLGDIALEQDDPSTALSAYRVVSGDEQVNPELRAQAAYGESLALRDLGRRDEAEQLLQQLIDSNRGGPLLASARLGLARLYVEDGRPGKAEELFRQVASDSDSEVGAEALVRLGQLLRSNGNAREAILELDRVSALFPGYPAWVARALLEQARAHRQLGQTGEASKLYDQVIAEHGGTRFAEQARTEQNEL
jgi:TolA-binding protein